MSDGGVWLLCHCGWTCPHTQQLLWDLTSTQPLWTLPEATKTTVLHVRATSSITTTSSLWLAVLNAATPVPPVRQSKDSHRLSGRYRLRRQER